MLKQVQMVLPDQVIIIFKLVRTNLTKDTDVVQKALVTKFSREAIDRVYADKLSDNGMKLRVKIKEK